jgi:membrane protease YdiL (CAAX protease family)
MTQNKERFLFGLLVFMLGMAGILSLLTMEITLPETVASMLKDRFSPTQIKFLILINPTIFLIIAVLFGSFLHDKVSLDAPIIKSFVAKHKHFNQNSILKFGIIGGVITGIVLVLSNAISAQYLPSELVEIGNNLEVSLANRFLYGGITEEILMRFGLMTLVVWLAYKVLNSLSPLVYWIGIIISSIVFGLGHFPIVFQTVAEPSSFLLLYILIANSLGGAIFGWLYWKKGLEAAMIAHIFAHIVMVLMSYLL